MLSACFSTRTRSHIYTRACLSLFWSSFRFSSLLLVFPFPSPKHVALVTLRVTEENQTNTYPLQAPTLAKTAAKNWKQSALGGRQVLIWESRRARGGKKMDQGREERFLFSHRQQQIQIPLVKALSSFTRTIQREQYILWTHV